MTSTSLYNLIRRGEVYTNRRWIWQHGRYVDWCDIGRSRVWWQFIKAGIRVYGI